MNKEEFTQVVLEAHDRCMDILVKKGTEYSISSDRLSQFKTLSTLTGLTPQGVLWILALKHITSVSTMLNSPSSYNIEKWREKLADIRNYTYFLEALLIDIGLEGPTTISDDEEEL